MELIICFYIFGALVTFFLGIFKLRPDLAWHNISVLAASIQIAVASIFWPAFWVAVFLWRCVE